MRPIGHRFTFTTPYQFGPDDMDDEAFAARVGTEAEVIGHLTEPDEDHDEETLPMYRIRFTADAREIEAWPEEVEPSLMTAEG